MQSVSTGSLVAILFDPFSFLQEVRDVFAAYGIAVDYRHLSLIADYMTYDGVYKAFNRTGLIANSSALQKMTYEASTMYLKNTMLAGECDHYSRGVYCKNLSCLTFRVQEQWGGLGCSAP